MKFWIPVFLKKSHNLTNPKERRSFMKLIFIGITLALAFIPASFFAESFDFSNVDIPRMLSECIDASELAQ